MKKKIYFALEISREGRGELASAAQQKSARFHGLPDSEIYTTEYKYALSSCPNSKTKFYTKILFLLKKYIEENA